MNTNGAGLFDKWNERTTLDYIVSNEVHHLNISRMHQDEYVNQMLMRYGDRYFSNDMLKDAIAYIGTHGTRVRLGCVLTKGGISTLSQMVEYIEFYQSLGIDHIIFREMTKFPDSAPNSVKKAYCYDNKVALADIWDYMDRDVRFKRFKVAIGDYSELRVYQYGNVEVATKTSDAIKARVVQTADPDLVYGLVLHPNGNLTAGWIDDEDILLKSEGSTTND